MLGVCWWLVKLVVTERLFKQYREKIDDRRVKLVRQHLPGYVLPCEEFALARLTGVLWGLHDRLREQVSDVLEVMS